MICNLNIEKIKIKLTAFCLEKNEFKQVHNITKIVLCICGTQSFTILWFHTDSYILSIQSLALSDSILEL